MQSNRSSSPATPTVKSDLFCWIILLMGVLLVCLDVPVAVMFLLPSLVCSLQVKTLIYMAGRLTHLIPLILVGSCYC